MSKEDKLKKFRREMFPNLTSKVDKIRIRDEVKPNQKQTKPIVETIKNKRENISKSENNISIRSNVNEIISKRLRANEYVTPFPVRAALATKIGEGRFVPNSPRKSREEEEAKIKRKEEEQKQKEKEAQEKAIRDEARERTQGGI